jgi:hypothetical protein
MTLTIRIQNLATRFLQAPASPNHGSADTWSLIAQIGGDAAILYGIYLQTPARQRWRKRDRAQAVADALFAAVKEL